MMNCYSSLTWFLFLLSAVIPVRAEDPCFYATNVSNVLRRPAKLNSFENVELCDSDLLPGTWYDLGGEITNACVDLNYCSTYSGIWYFTGIYPTGNETVTGTVCAKIGNSGCCGWSGTIKIKKCPSGYIYQLAIPTACPMSYCVGEAIPCKPEEVFNRKDKICSEIPTLDKPVLSEPYISAYKLYNSFNATAFSIDCLLKSNKVVNVVNKLKVEVTFKMNGADIVKNEVYYPVDKVSLPESYLKGHIGKTLTCEAQLFYEYDDGSQSTKTDVVRSDGFYFGINVVDSTGSVLKEIQIQQGNAIEIYLQTTFPITFGHCVYADQCTLRKYSFITKENKVSQNLCQIQFENPTGIPVYKSKTSIKISAQVTPGIENTRDLLAFNPYSHLLNVSIFEGFTIASTPVIVVEDKQQPTCSTTGDPHILSFSGAYFHNYLAGDFNLLSTKHRTFQIQIRQIPCYETVACNCGVIAREGNNLVGINSCDYRKTPYIIDLMKDNINPSASIQKINNGYLIQFVSGISIKVDFFYDPLKQATYLNIYVNGLKNEEYEGVCAASTMPDLEKLRIPYSESFFKGQLPPCVNEVYNFPVCKCIGNDKGDLNVVCSYDQPNRDTDVIKFENICDLNNRKKRSTDEMDVPIMTSERDMTNKLTLQDIFKDIDRGVDNKTVTETINMPLNEAQDICSIALRESKYFHKCQEFLKDKYENLYQSCIADVQLSGNGDVSQIYLNIYEEVCMTTLSKEVAIIDGEKSPNSTEVVNLLGEMNETFAERQANSSTPWVKEEIPDITLLEKPMLNKPYISAYKMYNTFNATAFSIDCIIDNKVITVKPDAKLKVEVIFRLNEMDVAKFERDYPVDKVSLEESYLKGQIGKTLTCEVRLFYSFVDGSSSSKSDAITSEGFHFGINAVDSVGTILGEVQIKQSVAVDIYLQTTFPITFGHCVYTDECTLRKYSFTTKENKVSQNDCQIQFENPFGLLVYKSTSSVKISTKVTLGIERNTSSNLAFNTYTHVSKVSIFENFTIAPIKITVVDVKPQPTCHSIGDPHIVSFGGVSFNTYLAGDFNLLSSKQRHFQIQVRQIPCSGGTISCNCGVIAREQNNLIGISSCDYLKTPVIIDLMKDNVNPTASIQKINNDYLIQFISGVSIKVNFFFDPTKQATYLNVYVNGLKHEEYGGMCAAITTPADLEQYRISHEQSFFMGKLPPCVNEVYNFTGCKCIGKEDGKVSVVCDVDQPKSDVDITKFDNICDLEEWMNGTGEGNVSLITSDKDITNTSTLDDVFKTINHTIDNEVVKETKNMPLEEAQDHCSKVLKQSKYFDKCKEILIDKYESIQQSCVADAQLSGNLDIVQIYLNVYEEVCITTLGKEVVIIDGKPSPESGKVLEVLGEMNETFSERAANASTPWTEEEKPEIPSLEKPILSGPYISAHKMYDTFNATAFSIDCNLKSNNAVQVIPNRNLKVEVIFKMNNMEVAKFEVNYPVDKVSLEEAYLGGHIGKTLTCEARLFYLMDDGSETMKTEVVTSEGYYFGINAVDSTGAILTEIQLKQGIAVEIYLQSTFPVTFGHCVYSDQCTLRKYSFTTKENKVSQNDCQIQFENPTGLLVYNSTTSIKISAQVRLGVEYSRDLLAFSTYTHVSNVSIFENFTIAPIQVVVVEDKQQPTCHTTGDPHILSFSGAYFHNYLAGDFNLLSTKHRKFQIQVRQIPCYGGSVTCNCGVIAREGNHIIGINSCDYRKTPMIFDLMTDNVNPSASILKTNNEYMIRFVSGISIKVNYFFDHAKQATYLNIYVNGLKHEVYEGMCAATTMPDLESLRIPYEKSFFKEQLPSCVNEVHDYPVCKCVGNEKGHVSVLCDYDEPIKTDDVIKFDNICDLEKVLNRTTEGGNVTLIISGKDKSNTHTIKELFETIDRAVDKHVVKETIKMPLNEAQDHCAKAFKLSKHFDKCQELMKDQFKSIEKSCIADVQLSGNAVVAQIYLNIFEEVCMTTLGKEVVIVDGEASHNSSDVLEMLGQMNETFAERQANASTPWVEEKTFTDLIKWIKDLKPGHVIIFSGTFLLIGAAVVKF